MIREVILEKRDCDVCGSQDLESLWSYEKNICAADSRDKFLFKVNDVICRDCGFTFVSPRFNEGVLAEYYGSSLRSPLDQALDYDIGFRMDTINRVSPKVAKAKFIEIGPSSFGEFQGKVAESFSYLGIEPSEEFGGQWKNVQDLNGESTADIVAHYFVLEHIPNPLKFLVECNRLLKLGGVMIVEVPSIEIYPIDPVALYLFEHQSHFSSRALESLASKAGFIQIEYAAKSSRSFGMTAVFRKIHESATINVPELLEPPSEYQVNRDYFERGLLKVRQFIDSLSQAKDFLERSNRGEIILWGANQNLIDFLAHAYPNSKIPDSLICIDSDPRKRTLLQWYDKGSDNVVFTPYECIESIKKSNRLILFTRRHKQVILDQIINLTGKKYQDSDILTVDINP